jgi:hypothetical protein
MEPCGILIFKCWFSILVHCTWQLYKSALARLVAFALYSKLAHTSLNIRAETVFVSLLEPEVLYSSIVGLNRSQSTEHRDQVHVPS